MLEHDDEPKHKKGPCADEAARRAQTKSQGLRRLRQLELEPRHGTWPRLRRAITHDADGPAVPLDVKVLLVAAARATATVEPSSETLAHAVPLSGFYRSVL